MPSEKNRIVAEGAAAVATESARGDAEVQKLRSEAELYRRTRAALYDPDARGTIAEPVAQRMALLLGWSAERTTGQARAVRERLAADLAFREEMPGPVLMTIICPSPAMIVKVANDSAAVRIAPAP